MLWLRLGNCSRREDIDFSNWKVYGVKEVGERGCFDLYCIRMALGNADTNTSTWWDVAGNAALLEMLFENRVASRNLRFWYTSFRCKKQ